MLWHVRQSKIISLLLLVAYVASDVEHSGTYDWLPEDCGANNLGSEMAAFVQIGQLKSMRRGGSITNPSRCKDGMVNCTQGHGEKDTGQPAAHGVVGARLGPLRAAGGAELAPGHSALFGPKDPDDETGHAMEPIWLWRKRSLSAGGLPEEDEDQGLGNSSLGRRSSGDAADPRAQRPLHPGGTTLLSLAASSEDDPSDSEPMGYMGGVPSSRREMYFRPTSITMYCVMVLTAQSLLVYMALSFARNWDELMGYTEASTMTEALTVASRSGVYAGMIAVFFVGVRLYTLAATRGLGEPYWWVKICMISVTIGMVLQSLLAVASGLAMAQNGEHRFTELAGDPGDAHLIHHGIDFDTLSAKILVWWLTLFSMCLIYCGIAGIMIGLAIFSAGAPLVSVPVGCTFLLSTIYFIAFLISWLAGVSPGANSGTFRLRSASLSMTMSLHKAPMMSILFLMSRLRALQLDPPHGNSLFVDKCCFLAMTVLLYIEGLVAAYIGGTGIEKVGYYRQRIFVSPAKSVNFARHILSGVGYSLWVPIIYNMIIRRNAKGDLAPLSTTAVSVLLFVCLYLAVHGGTRFMKVWRDVARTRSKMMENTLVAVSQSITITPVFCALFVACRMRALQITVGQGNPQGWAQDCMMLCVCAVYIQTGCCCVLPLLSHQAAHLDSDGAPIHDARPLWIAFVITLVKYVSLLSLIIGICLIFVAICTITPKTAMGKPLHFSDHWLCDIVICLGVVVISTLLAAPRVLKLAIMTGTDHVEVMGQSFTMSKLMDLLGERIVSQKLHARDDREEWLHTSSSFALMNNDQIAIAAGAMEPRIFEGGDVLFCQGDVADALFVIQSGVCTATAKTISGEEEELARYTRGIVFGEEAFLGQHTRPVTVTALSHVEALGLTVGTFESLLMPLPKLHEQQSLTDPRKSIYEFYQEGDLSGPAGFLRQSGASSVAGSADEPTSWFSVYRPCAPDSISKMIGREGVGKGLNVKGKSAKRNRLSGFVPFIQISDNEHKKDVETSPPDARVRIFYKSIHARDEAQAALTTVLEELMSSTSTHKLEVQRPIIKLVNDYPRAFGLDMPEALMREAYIMRRDQQPKPGWETGRPSEPAYMNMNLHSIRNGSKPPVVVYQYDAHEPMNPKGLLVAYAEDSVVPVVSDFDTFTVGSTGMEYDTIPKEQVDLMKWSLEQTRNILHTKSKPWNSSWLKVLKREEEEKGFHPTLPEYGLGDPTSYRLIGGAVVQTSAHGAVRHGAECFNFYFPQELDDEYLVVWSGFGEEDWKYFTEPELRLFLMDRLSEEYFFPLNPVWAVRDKGWYAVLQALRNNPNASKCLAAWYPPDSGVLEAIDKLHQDFPDGLCTEHS